MTLDRNNSVISVASNVTPIPIVVDYNITQITPYVFVTAEDSARQYPLVYSNGIGCVINVADELPQMVYPAQTGIESLKYPIRDDPTFPVSRYFDLVVDRIAANAAANRRTLLYCHHGRSRSITFILAYLIKHHHLPLPTAFALVREKRQLALPNVGFWSQLSSYEFYQRQQNQQPFGSYLLQNIQNTLTYGQQVLDKLANGLEKVFAHVPIVNTFTRTVYPNYQKPPIHHYYRRRPSVYSHVHHPRIYRRPFY